MLHSSGNRRLNRTVKGFGIDVGYQEVYGGAAMRFFVQLCLDSFVWRKKIEKDVIKGDLDPRAITLQNEKNRLASRMVRHV